MTEKVSPLYTTSGIVPSIFENIPGAVNYTTSTIGASIVYPVSERVPITLIHILSPDSNPSDTKLEICIF